jgi:beta-glucosidase
MDRGTTVRYARGADLVAGREDPRAIPAIDATYLRPARSRARGLTGEYFRGRELAGAPVLRRVDPVVDFRWDRGSPTSDLVARGDLPADRELGDDNFSVRWTGQLLPPVTGDYDLRVMGDDGFRLVLDGKTLIDEWSQAPRARAADVRIRLVGGKAYDVRLEYFDAERDAEVRLAWRLPGAMPAFDEAIEAARASQVVVFVGGLTGDVEGEEMRVSYPGFSGGDRTDIALPAPQQRLLEALQATGTPIVLVLMCGSALSVEWAQQHVRAIVLAWYPGQRGGNALADVLFGDVNPAGRLPVTFYRSVSDLPEFTNYDMAGRTYRYFRGEPLYPFGFGLSYTRFEYSSLRVDPPTVSARTPMRVSLDVRNTGNRAGDEVVQLYVRAIDPPVPMPIESLRAFERVPLAAGERRTVQFVITPAADLSYYDVNERRFVVAPGDYEIRAGASSREIRASARVHVN